MNEIIEQAAPRLARTVGDVWTPGQIKTIHRTIAADTTADEFAVFLEYCRVKQLDPFTKQVIAVVFSKDDAKKRKMQIITTQEGLRTLAGRCGDYRPASAAPAFTYTDEELARRELLRKAAEESDLKKRIALKADINAAYPLDPLNPLGIEECTTILHKQDGHIKETWHDVFGGAWWREFAPVRIDGDAYTWTDTGEKWEDTGKPKKKKTLKAGADLTKLQKLDEGNWSKMPRVMIIKVATMQALRAGWPAIFTGVYSEEEFDRTRADDLNAAELEMTEETQRRLATIGRNPKDLPFVTNDGNLSFVPPGRFGDTILQLFKAARSREELAAIETRNREGMKLFWAHHKADALDVKKATESIAAKLPTQAELDKRELAQG